MSQYLEFASNHPVLVAAFALVLIMLVMNEINLATRGFKDISPNDVTRLMNHGDTLLLDIRGIGEHREGHIVDSLHIPASELPDRINELDKYRNSHIIAYCRSGSRSASACKILKRKGFEHVHNLGGGIMAWQSDKLPVSKG